MTKREREREKEKEREDDPVFSFFTLLLARPFFPSCIKNTIRCGSLPWGTIHPFR